MAAARTVAGRVCLAAVEDGGVGEGTDAGARALARAKWGGSHEEEGTAEGGAGGPTGDGAGRGVEHAAGGSKVCCPSAAACGTGGAVAGCAGLSNTKRFDAGSAVTSVGIGVGAWDSGS
jgi:hypothetical protein